MGPRRSGTSTTKRVLSFVVSIGLIALAGWVFLNRQMLQDQLLLANYTPPQAIQALANGADLSNEGKRLFYVNKPELHNKRTFSDVCSGLGDEQSNVLGCFTGDRIFIYDVPDDRLEGVEEVTAAHEMLHSAYMRLSSSEKSTVDGLIKRQLETAVAPHVRDLISVYNRLEPGQLVNEMHSILGTEQKSLIPELEDYYRQYFKDRRVSVALSASYRGVFDSLKAQQDALSSELDTLAATINASTDQLNQQIEAYNASVEAFNARAQSGTMSEAEFNDEKAQLDLNLASIEVDITNNNALRASYEQKRKRFEALAVQATALQNSIDSAPVKPESVK